MCVVYKHIRLDNNEVFYIGIGTEKRAYVKTGRNKYWVNIVNKHGYKVEITHKDIIKEEAKAIEKYLISFYGRKDLGSGTLVNMTDGGDGCMNQSQETRELKSNIMKGEKNHRYGVPLSDENKKFLSNLWKGRTFSEETKRKLSEKAKTRTKNIIRYSKKVIDLSDGMVYNSITEASKKINKSIATLSNKLNNVNINNTTMRFFNDSNKGE